MERHSLRLGCHFSAGAEETIVNQLCIVHASSIDCHAHLQHSLLLDALSFSVFLCHAVEPIEELESFFLLVEILVQAWERCVVIVPIIIWLALVLTMVQIRARFCLPLDIGDVKLHSLIDKQV